MGGSVRCTTGAANGSDAHSDSSVRSAGDAARGSGGSAACAVQKTPSSGARCGAAGRDAAFGAEGRDEGGGELIGADPPVVVFEEAAGEAERVAAGGEFDVESGVVAETFPADWGEDGDVSAGDDAAGGEFLAVPFFAEPGDPLRESGGGGEEDAAWFEDAADFGDGEAWAGEVLEDVGADDDVGAGVREWESEVEVGLVDDVIAGDGNGFGAWVPIETGP
jgi:hypothetical protein